MPVTENLTQQTTGATEKAAQPVKNNKQAVEVSAGLLEDSAHGQMTVRGWNKMTQDFQKDLLLFKITQEATLKIEWSTLPDNLQDAFKEVLGTLKNKGEHHESETDGECFVFGFADEGVNISAVCTELNGRVAFFYKEV
ncbi:MAG: hypothetical protein SH857_05745 [Chitinophagales bacterium]|nr:hypothetical protein [Chitinophagales bacterium]